MIPEVEQARQVFGSFFLTEPAYLTEASMQAAYESVRTLFRELDSRDAMLRDFLTATDSDSYEEAFGSIQAWRRGAESINVSHLQPGHVYVMHLPGDPNGQQAAMVSEYIHKELEKAKNPPIVLITFGKNVTVEDTADPPAGFREVSK